MGKFEKCAIYIVLVLIVFICLEIINVFQKSTTDYDEETYSKVYDQYNAIEEENDEYGVSRIPEENSEEKQVDDNLVLGTIEIPKIGISYPVISTTTAEYLKIAPTKLAGVGLNEKGNCSIIGHNYENDKFFSKLGDLSKDDVVYIKEKDGMKRVYSVTEKKEISANDVSCLEQNTNDKRQVTLITCTNVKNKRLVVKCEEFV